MNSQDIEFEENKVSSFSFFMSKIGQWIKYYFIRAEPYIVKMVNTLFFEASRLIRNFFKYAIRQITLKD